MIALAVLLAFVVVLVLWSWHIVKKRNTYPDLKIVRLPTAQERQNDMVKEMDRGTVPSGKLVLDLWYRNKNDRDEPPEGPAAS